MQFRDENVSLHSIKKNKTQKNFDNLFSDTEFSKIARLLFADQLVCDGQEGRHKTFHALLPNCRDMAPWWHTINEIYQQFHLRD